MESKQITEQLELLNEDFPKTLEALEDPKSITWADLRDDTEAWTIACVLVVFLIISVSW